jgi:hypothetical protein
MVYERNKTFEINIDGLSQGIVVKLEKLIALNHSDSNKYQVVVIAQGEYDVTPYKVIKTTYLVNANENLLLKIKSLYQEDDRNEINLLKKSIGY